MELRETAEQQVHAARHADLHVRADADGADSGSTVLTPARGEAVQLSGADLSEPGYEWAPGGRLRLILHVSQARCRSSTRLPFRRRFSTASIACSSITSRRSTRTNPSVPSRYLRSREAALRISRVRADPKCPRCRPSSSTAGADDRPDDAGAGGAAAEPGRSAAGFEDARVPGCICQRDRQQKRRTVTQTRLHAARVASDANTFPGELYVAAFAVEGLARGVLSLQPARIRAPKTARRRPNAARLTPRPARTWHF